MKLRGHDGAVLAISYDLAMIQAAAAGKLQLGTFERRPCLLWAPPPPPTVCDSFVKRAFAFFGIRD